MFRRNFGLKCNELATRSDRALGMKKSGEIMQSYLPQLLPRGERAMTLREVENPNHSVPVRLAPVR